MTLSQKNIVAKLHQLPSLPLIVQEVIASFNDADLDTVTLAHKIAQDQGLSAKVLRVANSTFYGLPRKVGSVQDAVMVLGFDTVRSLVLSAGMVRAFPPSPDSLFDRQAYWQRCFRVAALSKALAKELRQVQQLAFTAGMFYDIGQLVLDLCIPQQFAELLQRQTTSGLSLAELERSELGFDHADIGAELIRLWNFPPEIEQVARYWQQPELQTNYDPLVCVVHAATLLESGVSGKELMARLSQTWCGRMQMTWERIEACLPSPDQMEASASLTQNS
ncbi:MAG: metal dependent phosphohydrolase [Gallionellaceae bacterium]|nr:MAG: metal dependent phosphohydrolase [Gallionellaceae bacterium]